jgi:hypothetical protein
MDSAGHRESARSSNTIQSRSAKRDTLGTHRPRLGEAALTLTRARGRLPANSRQFAVQVPHAARGVNVQNVVKRPDTMNPISIPRTVNP